MMQIIIYFLIIYVLQISHGTEESYNNTANSKRKLENIDHDLWRDAIPNVQIWSTLLEEWATNPPEVRQSKFLRASHELLPGNGFYISKPIIKRMDYESNNQYINNKINPGQSYHVRQKYDGPISSTGISETDLYLLSAIEKLVYRVDYLESRLRKTDHMVQYLIAENNNKYVKEYLCSKNFTKIGEFCYHVGLNKYVNWKTANAICKTVGSKLAEFETQTEFQNVASYLHDHKYEDYTLWLGALNPGLLWIWYSSARPVIPYSNTTVSTNTTLSNITEFIGQNSTSNFLEIKGIGRCLNLMYNASSYSYNYVGRDCNTKHYYLCEKDIQNSQNEVYTGKEIKTPTLSPSNDLT